MLGEGRLKLSIQLSRELPSLHWIRLTFLLCLVTMLFQLTTNPNYQIMHTPLPSLEHVVDGSNVANLTIW
jgi:hypothetical protein